MLFCLRRLLSSNSCDVVRDFRIGKFRIIDGPERIMCTIHLPRAFTDPMSLHSYYFFYELS